MAPLAAGSLRRRTRSIESELHLRIAGIPDGAALDLSLVKLLKGALMFSNTPAPGEDFSFTKLCTLHNITKKFVRKAARYF